MPMTTQLLRKYIAGRATQAERDRVVEWIDESPDNMRQYMAERRLYEISLWRTNGDDKARKTVTFTFRRVAIELLKIAALIAVALPFVRHIVAHQRLDVAPTVQSISVPAGQRTELTLADGTHVWLNACSTLTFPTNFEGDTRTVNLEGEGYFNVATNPNKPFVVHTYRLDVMATGTEFCVTSFDEDGIWRTALLKGSVKVYKTDDPAITMTLTPGKQVEIVNGKLKTDTIPNEDNFLWRDGLISFYDLPVGEIFTRIEAYFDVKITVNNTQIINKRYTGKFRREDGVEHILRVLKLRHKFTYQRSDDDGSYTIN